VRRSPPLPNRGQIVGLPAGLAKIPAELLAEPLPKRRAGSEQKKPSAARRFKNSPTFERGQENISAVEAFEIYTEL
jgi:hypothetical protein